MLPDVLFRNMGDFFVQLILLAFEAIQCLQIREMGYAEEQANNILKLYEVGKDIFRLEEGVLRSSPK